MSNDNKTNEFIRDCVGYAARFTNTGCIDAAGIMINAANDAATSPQDTAPIHHYIPNLISGAFEAYGLIENLAALTHRKQIEAVELWGWIIEQAGENDGLFETLGSYTEICNAISEMRAGGEGWR